MAPRPQYDPALSRWAEDMAELDQFELPNVRTIARNLEVLRTQSQTHPNARYMLVNGLIPAYHSIKSVSIANT
ncbi:hypothetical protein N7519_008456 [Penicillium mononematosum]|uniref:uncharacterized protein n=1 Tax=Penicillium mononematosum TaxID=268346 RepID=UPI002547BBCA|nr:uncharacterized protein N7519_008456 [Penicillium mononematosum]KAJ6177995.1 hypothetical protein N7519_008456 [Penicillium mononematosum]